MSRVATAAAEDGHRGSRGPFDGREMVRLRQLAAKARAEVHYNMWTLFNNNAAYLYCSRVVYQASKMRQKATQVKIQSQDTAVPV